jgi:hypothetical protein
MAINEILGSGALPVDPLRKAGGVADDKKATERKDRVEVSNKARSLFEADQAKKDDEIRARISSGFYSSPDVLDKIAAEVLKDLRAPQA